MYFKIAKDLKTKLQIPRLHLEFLKTKGTLEHFVSAKITGDNEAAKWALLEASKKEIGSIEREKNSKYYEQLKIDKRKETFKKYNMMGALKKINDSKRSKSYKEEFFALDDSNLHSFHSIDSVDLI